MPATTVSIMHTLPSDKMGLASGAFNMSRQIGSLLAVAIFGTILSTSTHFITGMFINFIIGLVVCVMAFGAAMIWIREEK